VKLDLSRFPFYIDWGKVVYWGTIVLISGCFLIAVIMAFGCVPKSDYVWPGPLKSISISKEPQDNLEEKFQEVLDFCAPRLNSYELKSKQQASKAYWLNVSGAVAGSVVVPALIASGWGAPFALALQAGLAGYAGSVPFMGNALRQSGLSGMAAAQTRNVIVERISRSAMVVLDASKSYEERRSAIMSVAAECTVYPIFVPENIRQEAMQ